MKTFCLSTDYIIRLSGKVDKCNVVLGTGAMARDLQAKLRLLGRDVLPHIYGSKDDESAGIRHYERLRELDKTKEYIFHQFFDSDEWTYFASSKALINEINGLITEVDWWIITPILLDNSDGTSGDIDMFGNINHSINRKHFVRHGDNSNSKTKIQIWGGSIYSDIVAFAEPYMSECLHSALSTRGIPAVIDNHSHWTRSVADNIPKFLSDGLCGKPDIVLMIFTLRDMEQTFFACKNILALRSSIKNELNLSSRNVNRIVGDVASGIHFDMNMLDITVEQHRVMTALSKAFNFKYYPVVNPTSLLLPEHVSSEVNIRSSGYLARYKKRKNEFVAKASRYGEVLDLSNCFDEYNNVFPFFMDDLHLTSEGSVIAANYLADELIERLATRE